MPTRDPWDEMNDQLRAQLTHAKVEAPRADFGGDTGCTECGLPIGDRGRWYTAETGALLPYCKA